MQSESVRFTRSVNKGANFQAVKSVSNRQVTCGELRLEDKTAVSQEVKVLPTKMPEGLKNFVRIY